MQKGNTFTENLLENSSEKKNEINKHETNKKYKDETSTIRSFWVKCSCIRYLNMQKDSNLHKFAPNLEQFWLITRPHTTIPSWVFWNIYIVNKHHPPKHQSTTTCCSWSWRVFNVNKLFVNEDFFKIVVFLSLRCIC